jgi:hypothetical protein
MKKFLRVRFLAVVLAVGFVLVGGWGAAFETAFAAAGDMIGLTDLATYDTYRPNVYDVDMDDITMYDLEIYPIFDNGTDSPDIGWFPNVVSADPSNFTWAPSTTVFGNFDVDLSSGIAVNAGNNHWYYQVTIYGLGTEMGPEGWRAAYTPLPTVSSDFVVVARDDDYPDSGSTFNIGIEFYNGNPSQSMPFAEGTFDTVNGNDDYAEDARGRSYPTVLDAVEHGTQGRNHIIQAYHWASGKAMLGDVVDNDGVYHHGDGRYTGWLYAVYYQSERTPTQYTRDLESYIFGPDDYKFKDDERTGKALIIWAIGALGQYDTFFPTQITRN